MSVDLQFCFRFPQHQYNVTTRVVKTLSSAHKRTKISKRGEGSIDDLLKGLLNIITSVSANIFDAKTNVVHHHKESSDDNDENGGSSVVILNPYLASKSRVAITSPKMSILFNLSENIKVGYFGHFVYVDNQRAHCETFGNNPMIFPSNPNNQNKNMTEKELYAFSELCMLDILFILLGNFMLVEIMLMIQVAHMRCAKQLQI